MPPAPRATPSPLGRLSRPVLLALAFGAAPAAPGAAAGQPIAIPVMDALRREAAAVYDDERDDERVQQVLEWAYDLVAGMDLGPWAFREAAPALEAASGHVRDAAPLGYAAGDLAATFEAVFGAPPDAPTGIAAGHAADFAGHEARRIEALLATYRALLAAGDGLAGDLEGAAAFARGLRGRLGGIGRNAFGFEGLGSHQQSAQAGAALALHGAEEALHLRQALAAETNADAVRYADEVALDALRRHVLRRALYGAPPPE